MGPLAHMAPSSGADYANGPAPRRCSRARRRSPARWEAHGADTDLRGRGRGSGRPENAVEVGVGEPALGVRFAADPEEVIEAGVARAKPRGVQ